MDIAKLTPPVDKGWNNETRRVGVELEFAAVSAREGAALVASLFGGRIEEEDAHRFHIRDTELGGFVSELDTQYAHRPYDESASGASADGESTISALARFRSDLRKLYGDLSSAVVPCEIVCPPAAFDQIPKLDALVGALRQAGAMGTRSSPLYAFGAQLNPEIPSRDPADILAVLRAYLLVSPWLRAVMDIDTTRRLVAFADPFPQGYVRKVLEPSYRPGLTGLIEDYLRANPTRNRELDMLPLFAWLDADLVRRFVDDLRIKARPTFHYRLPDANIDEPDWTVSLEWRRWLVVERLAADPERLDAMARAYLKRNDFWPQSTWPLECSEWLVLG